MGLDSPISMIVTVLVTNIVQVLGSVGDRSRMFYDCVKDCVAANCSDTSPVLPLHLRLLQWSCQDECRYFCIWPTNDWFETAGIGVQQFYGKWPFVRFLGMQEPAATVFSLLNLACHVIMIKRFREKVNPRAPFFIMTHIYCFVCCHAWFWSTLFHIRDVRFTEIMDYLSALGMVMFSVYHFIVRMNTRNPGDTFSLCLALAALSYFVYHGYTVFFVRMDYGYNMIVNILFGAVNIVGWSIWCWRNYKQRPYVKQCAIFTALVAATTLLEVWDFPPIFWVFDAHALWHLSTSPLAVYWYRFLIDDCLYLMEEKLNFDKIN